MEQVVHGNCWVAYLDILGFRNMLTTFCEAFPGRLDLFVKNHYWGILEDIRRRNEYCRNAVSAAWFSDSFVLFSHDDTLKSFGSIASFASNFFREAACREMPLRGAIGFGGFYGDLENNIFLGPALNSACEYAEAQDWIGLVITPGARDASQKCGGSELLSYLRFVEHEVFFKSQSGGLTKGNRERLLAYSPHDSGLHGSLLTGVECLRRLAEREDPQGYVQKHRLKYERTLAFLRSTPPIIYQRVNPTDVPPCEDT